jgi:hypothetical protein
LTQVATGRYRVACVPWVTALFTAFNATVLKPWQVADPSSIVVIRPLPASGERYGTLSSLDFRYFRTHARTFSHLAASLGGGDPVGRADGEMCCAADTAVIG